MALDNRNRRASAITPGMPFRGMCPLPDTSLASEERYLMAGFYAGLIATLPILLEQIGNISTGSASGAHAYDFAGYFSGETGYSISPAVETGWTFNTSTGVLTIDTDADGTFGPYTVTASNGAGDVDSNPFTVKVGPVEARAYRGLVGRGLRRII